MTVSQTDAGEPLGEVACGLSVVDKSVNLAGNKNKITTPKVQKLREDIAKKRVINNRRPEGEGCNSAENIFKKFETLGLYVLSDNLPIDTKCDSLIGKETLAEVEPAILN